MLKFVSDDWFIYRFFEVLWDRVNFFLGKFFMYRYEFLRMNIIVNVYIWNEGEIEILGNIFNVYICFKKGVKSLFGCFNNESWFIVWGVGVNCGKKFGKDCVGKYCGIGCCSCGKVGRKGGLGSCLGNNDCLNCCGFLFFWRSGNGSSICFCFLGWFGDRFDIGFFEMWNLLFFR